MKVFPLLVDSRSYRSIPVAGFNGARSDPNRPGRRHGACDMYVPVGSAVLAPEDGEVIGGPYPFYSWNQPKPFDWAIEIRFTDGRVARMGELIFLPHIRVGRRLVAGEQIGTVADLRLPNAMLHFELYSGSARGSLNTSVGPYYRRADLVDPSSYLDDLKTIYQLLEAKP